MLTTLALLLPLAQDPQPTRFPDFPEQDAVRYDVRLGVDLANQAIDGNVRYTIRAVERLSKVRFHARQSEKYGLRFYQGQAVLPAAWDKDVVTLTLKKPIPKGQTFELRAALTGKPVDGFYFKKNRYGEMLAFTDHYSIRARGWLPCEDHPGDRAIFHATIVYPEGTDVVCYGKEVQATDSVDTWTMKSFESEIEIPPYMFAVVVGPFARVAEKGDPRLVPHLVYKKDAAKAKRALVHHAAWIRKMEATFGPYPYAKYTTVQCPTRWGGFEAPGNVQLSERLFDRGGVGTLAHELVHMWFGDAVGYARWREVWLSEGFASYFGPWLYAGSGGPTLQQSMKNMRDRWRKSFEGRTKTIRDDGFPHPDQALNSNTYPKGAWVLHMLRGELGDELFFAALGTYYKECKGRSVVTTDFVRIVERVTKRELDWFFDQWLDRVDCPHLKITEANGNIVIEQVQKGEPYTFWLRFSWPGPKGKTNTMRVRVEERKMTIPGSLKGKRIDPNVELLFRRKT